jgi:outer membrane lipoprotein
MTFLVIIILTSTILLSCTPVIRKDLMESGSRSIPFAAMRSNPDSFKGKLFILGGIIVKTKVTDKASIVEAMYVPADKYGKLLDIELTNNRFRAVFPQEHGFLDPLIYRKGREITVAGEFTGTEPGKIDEMEYIYSVFEIRELYLWDEREYYYGYPPYSYRYDPYYYGWYEPWWYRPYYVPPPYPYDYYPKK